MQSHPFTELLFIVHPGIPAAILQRYERGPMHISFLRAGDGCDVQYLGVPPEEPAVLATVRKHPICGRDSPTSSLAPMPHQRAPQTRRGFTSVGLVLFRREPHIHR